MVSFFESMYVVDYICQFMNFKMSLNLWDGAGLIMVFKFLMCS